MDDTLSQDTKDCSHQENVQELLYKLSDWKLPSVLDNLPKDIEEALNDSQFQDQSLYAKVSGDNIKNCLPAFLNKGNIAQDKKAGGKV